MSVTESDNIFKSLFVEFLGTFTLVFVGTSAIATAVSGASESGVGILLAALAFGLALMTLIYVWGSYSGAHFNPAVSFGFAVAGQMNWGLMFLYWIAQLLGGIAAAALVVYFFGNAGASVGTLTNTDVWKAVLLEALLTFLLVIAYLFIYRNPMLAIISGIVIGSVLALATLAGGYLTGGSTNPARSLGSAIFSNNMGTIWIYIIGPLLGALVAALVYKLFTANFGCCYKFDECGKRIQDDCGNCIMTCEKPCLDKCGRELKDECGKVITQKVEFVEEKHGYKQEDYRKQATEWMRKLGVDVSKVGAACDSGCPTESTTMVKESIAEVVPITPIMSVVQTEVPTITLVDQPLMSQPLMSQQPMMSQRTVGVPSRTSYSIPRY